MQIPCNTTATLENSSSREAPFMKPSWIATQTYVVLVDVLLVYVVVRLVQHKLNDHSLLKKTGSLTTRKNVMRKRMQNICIAVAIMDILYAISGQIYLIHAWNSQMLCQTTILFCAVINGFSALLTFVFLWWRQRVLYSNQLLKHLSNKVTKALSWISIAVIAAVILVPTLSQIGWRKYNVTDEGCTLITERKETFKVWYILYLSGYCIGQLLLLGLYVHPLIRHKKPRNLLKNNDISSSTTTAVETRSRIRFRDCIVRSGMLTVICITTGSIFGVVESAISDRNRERWVILIPHQFVMVINLICMVCCFSHWKDILLPGCSQPPRITSNCPESKNDSFDRKCSF